MDPTNQSIKDRPGDYESKSLTLEEMDVLCRKCHHLHDEEIILVIGRFFRVLKKFFTQNAKWGITMHRQVNNNTES
jgi:hypothetical protein